MTPDEIRDAIGKLGLTQVAAARLLGVDASTFRRWLMDGPNGRAIPEPAARFLRYLIATGRSGEHAMRKLGL